MGRKLRILVGALKDKATLTTAAFLSPTATTSPHLAVLRATAHSSLPPSPYQISSLLSFGHSSRLSASSLLHSLSSRLLSARHPSVALKSLLSIHHLLSRGAFILQDVLLSSLLPSSGRRSPLNLSSFRHHSLSLSSFVRWFARLLELLLSLHPLLNKNNDDGGDRITSLLNKDLLKEVDSLVTLLEEIRRRPETSFLEAGNKLVEEVVRLVEEDRVTAEHEILVRAREAGDRLGGLGFADSVELVCLLRRLEECRPLDGEGKGGDSLWGEVRELRERAGEVVVREERGRVRRERGFDSARFTDNGWSGSVGVVRFSSARLMKG